MKLGHWEPDPQKFLTRKDIEQLLSAARDRLAISATPRQAAVRDLFVINLGLATGLRVMEIAALNCGDLKPYDSIPSLFVQKGKGNKRRRVFFNKSFSQQCRQYLAWKQSKGESTAPDQPLLLSRNTGRHLTTRAIQKAFKKCVQRAGLATHYSIHCLRHTYACLLLKASNWNVRLVQKQLGHSRITTTQVYVDVMLPDIQKAVEKIHL